MWNALWEGFNFRKLPWVQKIINMQPQEDIHAQYIEDITCLSTLVYSGWQVNFLVEPFKQCTLHIYIYIYTDNISRAQTFAIYI